MAMPRSASPIPATLIPGDGIGPEITDAVVAILDALGSPFAWDVQHGGMAAIAASATRCRRRCSTASGARALPSRDR